MAASPGTALADRRAAGPRRGAQINPVAGPGFPPDRTAAEAVRGEALSARRDDAPELPEGEWWAEDLEGCAVLADGRQIGVVKRLIGLPSCEALEVQRADEVGELLVPLVFDAVREVDVEQGEIEIDLQFLGEGPAP